MVLGSHYDRFAVSVVWVARADLTGWLVGLAMLLQVVQSIPSILPRNFVVMEAVMSFLSCGEVLVVCKG